MVEVTPPSSGDFDQSDAPITWESVLLQLMESYGPLQVTQLLDGIFMASVDLDSSVSVESYVGILDDATVAAAIGIQHVRKG